MLTLRIALESPLCSGSGLSRPGVADREVVFDNCGLPWLPGRRLKGLLRDAWTEVSSTLVFPPEETKRLFGEGGQELPGNLNVGNAYLRDYEALREWAVGFTSGDSGASHGAAIMEWYSDTRRQTSMDRQTGAPKQDTLRSTRTLSPGLVFEALVACAMDHRWAIALAAAALRQMGSSRWRGLGRVKCELVQTRTSGATFNWTEAALRGLSADHFEIEAPPAESAAKQPNAAERGQIGSSLAYELVLTAPVVFPVIAGNPNTVATATCVPGAAVHGWFAREHGDFDSDQFRRLFTSGAVRFLNANPAIIISGAAGDDVGGARAHVVPRSVRGKKDTEGQYVDLTATQAKDIRRAEGWCDAGKLAEGNLKRVDPETTIHYHHARAKGDLFQRALGPEEAKAYNIPPEEAGAFFQYEALLPGQKFVGEIRGDSVDLSLIRALAPNGGLLELGRSRRAQYGGGARLTWITSATTAAPGAKVSEFRVVARSAVLGYDANGMPAARFPTEELERELGCSLEVKHEFARMNWESGYLGHLRFQRPQQPAWAAGSVLVLGPESERPIDATELSRAAMVSYGLRREHGYGEVDLLAQPASATILGLDAKDRASIPAATTASARTLALGLFGEATLQHARFAAAELAQRVQGRIPAAALLHRLLAMLRAQSEEAFRVSLSSLRDRASRQLDRCRVMGRRGDPIPEDASLAGVLGQPRRLFGESLTHQAWLVGPWRQVFPERPAIQGNPAGIFLEELLATLAKESRRKEA